MGLNKISTKNTIKTPGVFYLTNNTNKLYVPYSHGFGFLPMSYSQVTL